MQIVVVYSLHVNRQFRLSFMELLKLKLKLKVAALNALFYRKLNFFNSNRICPPSSVIGIQEIYSLCT